MARSAVVIGASSGIGATIAVQLAQRGYTVGIAARREDELKQVAAQHPGVKAIASLDLKDAAESRLRAMDLIERLGGVDLFVISAGTGSENPELDWANEADTIAVNVAGFTSMATLAMEHFRRRGGGHLVGISSIAAIRGHGDAPSYGASKAFVSNYLRALRHKCVRQGLAIDVTEIQPGFVATAMARGEGLFWVAPVDVAARQIVMAIESRRRHVYVTRRWQIIAAIMRFMPEWIYNRM